jgi:hypothetical protein
MRKNAALEASNVAVLLEHIPVGQTRSVHSLQVTRVEPDHYSIGGGRVIDLADAISQIGQYTGHGAKPMRSNPSTAWHLDTAMQYLDKSKQAEQAGDLWAAYDFATMGISEVTDVQQHTTKMWDGSQYVDQPLDKSTRAKANERLAPLLEQQRKLKAKLQPALRSNPAWDQPRDAAMRSNPQKAERGYFYEVLDKRGDVVMLTTTKAEAEEICADPAAFKLRKGGTFTLRHVGARSALEGPPIKRI